MFAQQNTGKPTKVGTVYSLLPQSLTLFRLCDILQFCHDYWPYLTLLPHEFDSSYSFQYICYQLIYYIIWLLVTAQNLDSPSPNYHTRKVSCHVQLPTLFNLKLIWKKN